MHGMLAQGKYTSQRHNVHQQSYIGALRSSHPIESKNLPASIILAVAFDLRW